MSLESYIKGKKRAVLNEESGNSAPESPRSKKKSKKAASSDAKDELSVFSLESSAVRNIVSQWLNGNAPGASFNASLPGRLDPVGPESLKFLVPEFEEFGPCWSFSTRKKEKAGVRTVLKLLEGGTNKDAPR